jgi:hypothetical protein
MSRSDSGTGQYPQIYHGEVQEGEIESQKTKKPKTVFHYLSNIFAKRSNNGHLQNDDKRKKNPFNYMPEYLKLPENGYRALANTMAKRRDLAIFRKFGALNMLNLLNLQAELMELQDRLVERFHKDDEAWKLNPNSRTWRFAYDFCNLRELQSVRQYT